MNNKPAKVLSMIYLSIAQLVLAIIASIVIFASTKPYMVKMNLFTVYVLFLIIVPLMIFCIYRKNKVGLIFFLVINLLGSLYRTNLLILIIPILIFILLFTQPVKEYFAKPNYSDKL